MGAEKTAPPGIGRRPMSAGNVTRVIRLSPTSFLNDVTILSNLPASDIPLERDKIPITITATENVSSEKIPFINALKKLCGDIWKKMPRKTLPKMREKLRGILHFNPRTTRARTPKIFIKAGI
jgi:hypothetical protein